MPAYKQTYTDVFSPSNETFFIKIMRLNRVLSGFFTVKNKNRQRGGYLKRTHPYKSQTRNQAELATKLE